jgi:hypothetical protein
MSSVPSVATSVGVDVLKKSEDAQQAAMAQLLAPLTPQSTTAPLYSTDTATFSPAALAQLGVPPTGSSLLT